jgi:hypothetical protein
MSSLINVSIVVERLLLNNKIHFCHPKVWFYFSLGVFTFYSVILYAPNLNILNINNENFTNETQLPFKINKRNKLLQTSIYFQYLNTALMSVIVIISTIILIHQLKKSFKNRNQIIKYSAMKLNRKIVPMKIDYVPVLRKNSFKNGKNASILVILLSVFFILNQFSYIMVFIAFFRIDSSSASYNFIIIIHQLLSIVFHGSNIFIYYKYNSEFSNEFKKIFKIK